MTERFIYLLIRFIEKAVWFLKIYIREYRYLLAFLAIFVFCYILFMHWLNIRFLRVMRRAAALACLGIELAAIANFTILFREAGTEHQYELELFWSYRSWIFGGSVELGMEVLNNILLFFPLGFILTDAFGGKCPLRAVFLVSFVCSAAVEVSQFVFRIGLFEFDDIFNNVLGALAGWCVFHILHSFRHRRKHGNVQKQDSFL